MGISGGIVVFVIVWWTVFFAVLPWGVKGQWQDKANMPKGSDPGAPIDPQIKQKALRTTWITAIIWVILYVIIASGIINPRQ